MLISCLKYQQKDKDVFVFCANPNYIRKLVKISDISKSDIDFQRPYDSKRVAEIKNYVLGKDKLYKKGKNIYSKGYIPNAIVLNLSTKYKVKQSNGNYLLEFPDVPTKDYASSIEVIDGQHRLLAFDDECQGGLNLNGKYEMCFVAFIDLTNEEKKEIFMVLNERQKTVDKNILLRHKKLLNLLLDDEETRYDIISRLNTEPESPFFDKIIVAGETKKYGLKISQVDQIFDASKALDKLIDSKGQIDDKKYKIIRNYFAAWQECFKNIWFVKNNTLTKIAGFRFLCFLFPFIYEVMKNNKDFTVREFTKIVKEISDVEFNENFIIKGTDKFQYFQEKSGIVKLASKIGKEFIEKYQILEEDILV